MISPRLCPSFVYFGPGFCRQTNQPGVFLFLQQSILPRQEENPKSHEWAGVFFALDTPFKVKLNH